MYEIHFQGREQNHFFRVHTEEEEKVAQFGGILCASPLKHYYYRFHSNDSIELSSDLRLNEELLSH